MIFEDSVRWKRCGSGRRGVGGSWFSSHLLSGYRLSPSVSSSTDDVIAVDYYGTVESG